MRDFKTSKTTNHEWWDGRHRFEHVGVKRALELRAFLEGVPYARYERGRKRRRR
jgi:hypothetical protein